MNPNIELELMRARSLKGSSARFSTGLNGTSTADVRATTYTDSLFTEGNPIFSGPDGVMIASQVISRRRIKAYRFKDGTPYYWKDLQVTDHLGAMVEGALLSNPTTTRHDIRTAAAKRFCTVIEKSVKGLHRDLRIRGVVLDTDRITADKLYMGLPFGVELLRVVNSKLGKLDRLPITLGDLEGLRVTGVREPAFEVYDFEIHTSADNYYGLFINFILLDTMGGDSDGDSTLNRLSDEVIKKLRHSRDKEGFVPTVRLLPYVTWFKLPVGKDGSKLSLTTLTGQKPVKGVDIAMKLMAKDFVSHLTSGFNKIVEAICLKLQTRDERRSFLDEAGIDYKSYHLRNGRAFRCLMLRYIRLQLVPILENAFDVRKNGMKAIEALREVLGYLQDGDTNLTEKTISLEANGATANIVSLNLIKELMQGVSFSEIIADDLHSAALGSGLSIAQATSAISIINQNNNVEPFLDILDGTNSEPVPLNYVEDDEEFDIKRQDMRRYPAHNLMKEDLKDFRQAVARRCEDFLTAKNGHFFFYGMPIGDDFSTMKMVGDKNQIGYPVIRITGKGQDRLSGAFWGTDVTNVSNLVKCGKTLEEVITPDTCRYFTLFDILAMRISNGLRGKAYDFRKAKDELEHTSINNSFAKRDMGRILKQVRYELSRIISETLETKTSVLLDENYEISIEGTRARVLDTGVFGLFEEQRVKELLLTIGEDQGAFNPFTGKIEMIDPGLTSKSHPGAYATYKGLRVGAYFQAHVDAGMDGVCDDRLKRESGTTRMSLPLQNVMKKLITNGCEGTISERFNELVVAFAELPGVLGYSHGERVINSDKMILTRHGAEVLKTIPFGKTDRNLVSNLVIEIANQFGGNTETIEEAVAYLEDLGCKVTSCKDRRIDSLKNNNLEPVFEESFNVEYPTKDDPTWKKVYMEGCKAIAPIVDQVFYVKVNGEMRPVDLIISGRTLDSKKMYSAVILGQLALLQGELQVDTARPIFGFGNNSYQEELINVRKNNDLSPHGEFSIYEETSEGLELKGAAWAAIMRTCVLREDPTDCDIRDGASINRNMIGLRGYQLSKLIPQKIKDELTLLAAMAEGKTVLDLLEPEKVERVKALGAKATLCDGYITVEKGAETRRVQVEIPEKLQELAIRLEVKKAKVAKTETIDLNPEFLKALRCHKIDTNTTQVVGSIDNFKALEAFGGYRPQQIDPVSGVIDAEALAGFKKEGE